MGVTCDLQACAVIRTSTSCVSSRGFHLTENNANDFIRTIIDKTIITFPAAAQRGYVLYINNTIQNVSYDETDFEEWIEKNHSNGLYVKSVLIEARLMDFSYDY